MKGNRFLIAGLTAALSFWGCSALVDVEEHAPETEGCLSCHADANLLQKLVIEEESSAAGGG